MIAMLLPPQLHAIGLRADEAAVARLERGMAKDRAEFESRVVIAVRKARPSMFGA